LQFPLWSKYLPFEHSTQTEPEHFEQNGEIDVQSAIEHEPLASVKP